MGSRFRTGLFWLVFGISSPGFAQGVRDAPADPPDPAGRYLFYLHGKIIEDAGRRPTHPRYGVYEYDAVLAALGRSGAVLISEQRPPNTAPAAYAIRVAAQIQRLLDHGVPASHIAVVGFSKGGAIARLVAARLQVPALRYVLLAACPDAGEGPARLHGQVLSIRERSDTVPSCKALFARSRGTATTRELQIAIGGSHGAFYRPDPAWLQPLLAFVAAPRP